MGGCGGHAVIKSSEKSSNYHQIISDLLIVIDDSHLQRAFLLNRKDASFPVQLDVDATSSAEARIAARNARVDDQFAAQKKLNNSLNAPTAALKESLISAFSAQGVDAEVQVVNIDRDRLAVGTIAQKYAQKKILFLNTAAFQTSQATLYGRPYGLSHWTGRVSWDARLIVGDKAANPEGKPVWSKKRCPCDAVAGQKGSAHRFETTIGSAQAQCSNRSTNAANRNQPNHQAETIFC